MPSAWQGYNLAEHIAGVFAAGGGREIQDQLKIHRVSKVCPVRAASVFNSSVPRACYATCLLFVRPWLFWVWCPVLPMSLFDPSPFILLRLGETKLQIRAPSPVVACVPS